MLTCDVEQTAAVLELANGRIQQCRLLDSPYSVFRCRTAQGAELGVACVEIGLGPADAVTEVGRLSVLHPDAVLVLLGRARPAAGATGADVMVGELVLAAGPAEGRLLVERSSPDLAAVAHRVASRASGPRAVVGVLGREQDVADGAFPVTAVEDPGSGFAAALSAGGRMKRLVVCGLEGDEQRADPVHRAQASRDAAGFAFSVLAEQLRLLQLEAPEHGAAAATGLTDPVGDEELSMDEEAKRWIDAVAVDPPSPPLDADRTAAAMARSDFLTANSLFFYELVSEVGSRVDDASSTWSGRSLRAYARECARCMASLCEVAPVRPGSPADMTVRFPIEEMLQRSPVGAAVMLSVPDAWRCLDGGVRARILCALAGPVDAPRAPTEVGWRCLLALVSSAELSAADRQHVARVVVSSSYDLLVRVRAPVPLVRNKVLADLMSSVSGRQDLAARYLYRDAIGLPGQLSAHDDYEVGRQLHTASRAGSHGAAEALSRANLARSSPARRAGVLMAALLIDDRYLRLELPAGERRVLTATSLVGDLAEVLALAAARLPPPTWTGEMTGYLAHATLDRLASLAGELPPDEALLWEDYVAVLRQRV